MIDPNYDDSAGLRRTIVRLQTDYDRRLAQLDVAVKRLTDQLATARQEIRALNQAEVRRRNLEHP